MRRISKEFHLAFLHSVKFSLRTREGALPYYTARASGSPFLFKFMGDIAGIFGLIKSEFLDLRHGGNGPRATHRCFGTAMVDVC
jgi:hypothetical protein